MLRPNPTINLINLTIEFPVPINTTIPTRGMLILTQRHILGTTITHILLMGIITLIRRSSLVHHLCICNSPSILSKCLKICIIWDITGQCLNIHKSKISLVVKVIQTNQRRMMKSAKEAIVKTIKSHQIKGNQPIMTNSIHSIQDKHKGRAISTRLPKKSQQTTMKMSRIHK